MNVFVNAFTEVDTGSALVVELLPPRLRRGLSMHQRLVIDRLSKLVDERSKAHLRIVHGSIYGELETAAVLATSSQVSPARFSTSVHSSAIGLASIALGNNIGHTTLSAGADTLVVCVLDALAELKEGRDAIVVVADETSGALSPAGSEPFGFAMRLSLTKAPGASKLELVADEFGNDARPRSMHEACVSMRTALSEGGIVRPCRMGFPALRLSARGES